MRRVHTSIIKAWKLSLRVSNTAAEAKVQRTRARMSAHAEKNGIFITHAVTEPVSSSTVSSMSVSAMCRLQGRQRCTVSGCNHDTTASSTFRVSMMISSMSARLQFPRNEHGDSGCDVTYIFGIGN